MHQAYFRGSLEALAVAVKRAGERRSGKEARRLED